MPTGLELLVESDEVFVITLDENRGPRRCASLGKPDREVPRAIMVTRGFVYTVGIGPNTEVADVKHVVKMHLQRLLEGEDIVAPDAIAARIRERDHRAADVEHIAKFMAAERSQAQTVCDELDVSLSILNAPSLEIFVEVTAEMAEKAGR